MSSFSPLPYQMARACFSALCWLLWMTQRSSHRMLRWVFLFSFFHSLKNFRSEHEVGVLNFLAQSLFRQNVLFSLGLRLKQAKPPIFRYWPISFPVSPTFLESLWISMSSELHRRFNVLLCIFQKLRFKNFEEQMPSTV